MTKLIKKISVPLISLIFLLNMSSAGMAETTVSEEVGFIFNTLLFLICGFLVMFMRKKWYAYSAYTNSLFKKKGCYLRYKLFVKYFFKCFGR